jgi:hypothetical protein
VPICLRLLCTQISDPEAYLMPPNKECNDETQSKQQGSTPGRQYVIPLPLVSLRTIPTLVD